MCWRFLYLLECCGFVKRGVGMEMDLQQLLLIHVWWGVAMLCNMAHHSPPPTTYEKVPLVKEVLKKEEMGKGKNQTLYVSIVFRFSSL